MFKLLLHITVIVAMLTQQLQMVVVCVVFKAEQTYLAKNVCVNRSKPNSTCKAHCQLTKRIHEQGKQESENKISLKEQTEFVAGFEKPRLTGKYFCETRSAWSNCLFQNILQGFCQIPSQPPELMNTPLYFFTLKNNFNAKNNSVLFLNGFTGILRV